MIDTYTEELQMEIAGLATQMIRLEQWAAEARAQNRWQRAGEYLADRDQACNRRSQLMRELWETRQ